MRTRLWRARRFGLGIRLIALAALGLLLGVGPLLGQSALAQEKTIIWERFDVDISVNVDGTFDVDEHQAIVFMSDTFTFGYRDIPVNNFSYIDGWAISDNSGNQYELVSGGQEPYTFTVDDSGGRYVIRWYFPPIANAGETYTLSYRVHGGLRFYEGGDQVWWKAIYGDRGFPVLSGQVRVNVPDPATIHEWAAYVNGNDARDVASARLASGEQTIVFQLLRRLASGEEFEVRAEFTDGVVDGVVQPWQQRADELAAEREAEAAFRQRWGAIAALLFGALGLLLTIGGPAALYALWHRYGRDRPIDLVADYLPEPPTISLPAWPVPYSTRQWTWKTLLPRSSTWRAARPSASPKSRRRAGSVTARTLFTAASVRMSSYSVTRNCCSHRSLATKMRSRSLISRINSTISCPESRTACMTARSAKDFSPVVPTRFVRSTTFWAWRVLLPRCWSGWCCSALLAI